LAQELVAQKPDLLLAIGGDIIKALFDATRLFIRSTHQRAAKNPG